MCCARHQRKYQCVLPHHLCATWFMKRGRLVAGPAAHKSCFFRVWNIRNNENVFVYKGFPPDVLIRSQSCYILVVTFAEKLSMLCIPPFSPVLRWSASKVWKLSVCLVWLDVHNCRHLALRDSHTQPRLAHCKFVQVSRALRRHLKL